MVNKVKKFVYVLLSFSIFMTSACSINLKTGNKNVEEAKKIENKVEKKTKKEEKKVINNEDIAGTYFLVNDYNNEIVNDEYMTLNTDGTFFKQVNFCAGIKHVRGSYSAVQENDVITVQFKVDGSDVTIPATLSDNLITIKYKVEDVNEGGKYVPVVNFFDSCGGISNDGDYNVMNLKKGSESDIKYLDEITAQIGPY